MISVRSLNCSVSGGRVIEPVFEVPFAWHLFFMFWRLDPLVARWHSLRTCLLFFFFEWCRCDNCGQGKLRQSCVLLRERYRRRYVRHVGGSHGTMQTPWFSTLMFIEVAMVAFSASVFDRFPCESCSRESAA